MKTKAANKENWLEWYSDYLLSNGKRPENVYVFSKKNKCSESDFYQHFSGFEALEKEYLVYFVNKSWELSLKIEGFENKLAKEKLLNFYFILFENFTLNRSLIIMLTDWNRYNLRTKLLPLKSKFNELLRYINFEQHLLFENAPEKVKKISEKSREEIIWIHFLSILDFWKKDQSPGFEKTDLYIEKSIDTGFDIVNNPIIDKFFDLGKFLWKEKFHAS